MRRPALPALPARLGTDSPAFPAQKLYLNVFFFGTRLFATHIVSFCFYCTIVPIAVIAPEIRIPFWALIYVPIAVTVSTVFFTPGGWKYTVAYILYENAMCVVKMNAMLSGLFELSNAHEWIVTTSAPPPPNARRPSLRSPLLPQSWATGR